MLEVHAVTSLFLYCTFLSCPLLQWLLLFYTARASPVLYCIDFSFPLLHFPLLFYNVVRFSFFTSVNSLMHSTKLAFLLLYYSGLSCILLNLHLMSSTLTVPILYYSYHVLLSSIEETSHVLYCIKFLSPSLVNPPVLYPSNLLKCLIMFLFQ